MVDSLVWLRDDLRVGDNPALLAASEASREDGRVTVLYVLDEESHGIRPLGGAARWWLHGGLRALEEELGALGISLVLRRGPAVDVVPAVAAELGADLVTWNRRAAAPELAADAAVKKALTENDVSAHSFQGSLLHEPWALETGSGGPYKVFTPFWRRLEGMDVRRPLDAPQAQTGRRPPSRAGSERLDDWELLPLRPDWAGGLRAAWDPTPAAGRELLQEFIDGYDYERRQDLPAEPGTSRLSPYLRWGQLSPFQVWHACGDALGPAAAPYQRQLGWREFCWHLAHRFGRLHTENLKPEFDRYPWQSAKESPERFAAWTRGETGFDFVDAGQKQLWESGWMHNRVRMVSASLLVKNLGIHWRDGEAWFWDTLVDADVASNPANWQWVAGSGADASPFFRIFNPERQAERFDARGDYARRWLGEGERPEPIVDLKESRRAALDAYEGL